MIKRDGGGNYKNVEGMFIRGIIRSWVEELGWEGCGRECVQEGGYVRTTRYQKLITKARGLLILVQNLLNKRASAGADELIYIGNIQVAIRIA
jgi:hypothetical protein